MISQDVVPFEAGARRWVERNRGYHEGGRSCNSVAWENARRQTGIRFIDLPPDCQMRLNAWLLSHSPELEKDDPPLPCKLTDLSLGGCYLEVASPFPVHSRLTLAVDSKL
ncbi:MAG: hypothetical protein ACRD2U_09420, partial [Terriglobales bacterium]